MRYKVTEAKNRLPELIKEAEAGNPVTITRRGKPVVEMVRTAEDKPKGKRVFGEFDKDIRIPDPIFLAPIEDAW